MTFDLTGKIALVIGAGRGIGAAIAACFAGDGASVIIGNRTVDLAKQMAQAIKAGGGNAVACGYDGRSRRANEELVEFAQQRFGGLDILVHNAASIRSSPLDDMDEDLLEEALDINPKACFWLSRACIPHLRRRGGGLILITSSVTGRRVASWGLSHYAPSKAGVNGFIKSVALELAPDAITVNGVEPGFIAQPEKGRTGKDAWSARVARHIPAGRIGVPEDIAFAMLYLASERASFVTGQTLVIDGGAMLRRARLR